MNVEVTVKRTIERIEEIEIDTSGEDLSKYKWLAVDSDGGVYIFVDRPSIDDGVWTDDDNPFICHRVATIDSPVDNPEETLQEVSFEPVFPVGTLVVVDKGLITAREKGSFGYMAGSITGNDRSGLFKYTTNMGYVCTDKSIVAAYDSETGEQLR